MADFERSILYLLDNEGGFVNNPNDSGKATKYGITMATLAAHRKMGVTVEDIENLQLPEAKDIYKINFWDRLSLMQLKQEIATAVLDMAVNMGEGTGIKLAQLAMGLPHADGIIGPFTLHQFEMFDLKLFMQSFVGQIQDHYCDIVEKNPKDLEFLKGWIRRAHRLMTLV